MLLAWGPLYSGFRMHGCDSQGFARLCATATWRTNALHNHKLSIGLLAAPEELSFTGAAAQLEARRVLLSQSRQGLVM